MYNPYLFIFIITQIKEDNSELFKEQDKNVKDKILEELERRKPDLAKQLKEEFGGEQL